jgi:hypothetical protein
MSETYGPLLIAKGESDIGILPEMANHHLPGRHRTTVGSDKAYDAREFVQLLRVLNAVPYVDQNCNGRTSAIDGRTTRHRGYSISQRLSKRVEEIFGWMETVGNLRKTRHRGTERVG